jgi:hypothetical protein
LCARAACLEIVDLALGKTASIKKDEHGRRD